MEFQWRIIRDKKSSRMGFAENSFSKTTSLPHITGRYSLGGTKSGLQINAEKSHQLFQIHCPLVTKAFENVAQTV